jgi:hypothetical protein
VVRYLHVPVVAVGVRKSRNVVEQVDDAEGFPITLDHVVGFFAAAAEVVLLRTGETERLQGRQVAPLELVTSRTELLHLSPDLVGHRSARVNDDADHDHRKLLSAYSGAVMGSVRSM